MLFMCISYIALMENEMTTIQVRLSKELHEVSKKNAKKMGLTLSAYIRYVLIMQEKEDT